MILLTDIKGIHPTKYYGKKGDQVLVLKVRGNVSIVEDFKGERFSVNNEFLAAPGTAATNPIINRELPVRIKAEASIKQPSLF